MLDRVLIFVQDYLLYVRGQFVERTLLMWFLFFFPLVVFLELPRYALPLLILPILKLLHWPPDDSEERAQFLSTNPLVSIIVAAHNEEETIAAAIESLLSLDYENREIIVVDDASTDRTYQIAKRYADQGRIKLLRNSGPSGRGGRPIASNFGLRMSTGDFIVSVDADTSFDRDLLRRLIGPFHDPQVGVVAANIKARNAGRTVWTNLQAAEYLMSIGLWKRWTNVLGTTLQASGACGAFRREALEDAGAWSAEITEDIDVSMKAKKQGWKVRFAPDAVALTNVPPTFEEWVRQRVNWERGILRLYYHKHGDAVKFWRYDLATAWEMAMQYLMTVVFNLLYAAYIVLMVTFAFRLLTFVLIGCYLFYSLLTFVTLALAISMSERRRHEWWLLQYACVYPLYKGVLRWVRFYALVTETLRLRYRDPYLPETAYDHAERW
ncbi:MAG: glycosyltransferase family 2 protein [Planctomycetota bacterium]|jgi:cellulose synthase/poly-beta-1,6-N-acetylglucosamine synthase-like glycosyltransferase